MKLDIQTLAFISSLTLVVQFIGLFVQYVLNRSFRGYRWLLLGSFIWAIGVIFLPLVNVNSLEFLARIANPLIILGQIFLYVGLTRFLDKDESRRVMTAIFVVFVLGYYYFMYFNNSISGRTIVLTTTLAVISFMTAFNLHAHTGRLFSGASHFTALAYFAYGCFSVFRLYSVVFSPPIQDYFDQRLILELSFVVPTITSLLWTFGFIIMVNQRLNIENLEEKEKLQLIFNTSPDAVIISRLADGYIVDVNAGFLTMSGYSRAEIIHNTTSHINIWGKVSDREKVVNELTHSGVCETMEFDFRRKDGNLIIGSLSARLISIRGAAHVVSVVHDITKSKQAEDAMRESEELYRSILNASPDDITITDLQGRVLVISPAAKKMFGYEPDYDNFIGSQLVDYIVPEDRDRAKTNIVNMCMGKHGGPNEYRGVRKDQSIIAIEVNSGLILGANGQPTKMVFIVRDITERKLAEEKIQQLIQQLEIEKKTAQLNANTDSLTGLANRRYFDEALTTEFFRLKRSGRPLSLIMMDLDYFKKFNDSYGHLAGDDCLRQIGSTLRSFVGRVSDTVARYGGEEFVALLTETDQRGAALLAERIRKAVEALAIPHSGSDIADYVTVSIGVVTVYPIRLATPEEVVALADEAMYCAKKDGRNRISVAAETRIGAETV